MRRLLSLGSAAVLVAAALGCARTPPPPEDPLRVLLAFDVISLDPNRSVEVSTDAVLMSAYEPLVGLDEDLKVQPLLASMWEHPDPAHWRFRLRSGVRFHDGSPLTASAVREALVRVKGDSSLEAGQFLRQAAQIIVLDDATIEIATREPRALLASLPFVYVAKPNAPGAFPPFLGTGPYRIEEWTPGQRIRLAHFEGYWGSRPEFRQVILKPEAEASERLRLLLRGDADLAYAMTPELAERQGPGVRFLRRSGLAVFYLGFDVRPRPGNPFSDVRVRRAFHLALDREAIVRHVLRGRGVVPTQPVAPLVLGFEPALPEPGRDPAEARRLLAEAGYPRGITVRFDFPKARADVARLVQEQLGPVGVKLALNPLVGDGVHELGKDGKSQLFLAGWSCSSGEAGEFYEFCLHTPREGLGAGNYGRYSNPRVDAIADTSAAILDLRQRQTALREAARIVMEDLPVLPLFIEDDIFGIREGLTATPRADGATRLDSVRRVKR